MMRVLASGLVGLGFALLAQSCAQGHASPAPGVSDETFDAGEGGARSDGGPPAAGNFALEPLPGQVQVAHGASVKVTVRVKRVDAAPQAIEVTTHGWRDGITSKPLTISGDSGDLEIAVPTGALTGAATGFIDANGGGHSASTALSLSVGGKPGEIDTSFGTNGSVGQLFGPSGGGARVAAMLLRPDDSFFVVGSCYSTSAACVVHLTAAGVIDPTYGSSGVARLGFSPNAAAFQPDGKIVVVGGSGLDQGYAGRLDAAGQPDATFGSGAAGAGIVHLTTGGNNGQNNGAFAVAVRYDGDIYIAWDNLDGAAMKNGSMRLAPDGTLRTAYGPGGTTRSLLGLTTAIAVRNNPASASKGNLFTAVAGGRYAPNSFSVVQVDGNTAGVDPKFTPYAKTVMLPNADRVGGGLGLVELADESIITAVDYGFTHSVYLRKCNAAGDGVASFGAQGIAGPFPCGGIPGGIAVQADGKILVALSAADPGGNTLKGQDALRFLPTGTLDPDFAPNGHPLNPLGSGQKVVVQKSGRIVIGGEIGASDTLIAGYWP